MNKLFKILKAIIGWMFLFGMTVASVFVLEVILVNHSEITAGLGAWVATFTFILVAGITVLFVRWMCRCFGIRSTVIVFGGLALLFGLFYAEEDWRGWQAWHSFKQQSEAIGEKLDYASIVPPAVPDDQNFALADVVASSYAEQLDKQGHRLNPPNTNVVNRLRMKIYRDSDWDRQPTNGYTSSAIKACGSARSCPRRAPIGGVAWSRLQ